VPRPSLLAMLRMLDLPADQRPRERLLHLGPHALTDAELVAVLLSVGQGGESALQLAHQVARLVAALALPTRREPMGEALVRGPKDAVSLFRPLLTGLRHERIVIVVCDRRARVRKIATVSEGASDCAPLPVRDMLSLVLRNDGYAFAVGHNHPSGALEVSPADRNATMRLRVAADAAGLRFIGHVVLTDDGWCDAT
jgi:DNA repair protein RadC